MHEHHLDVLKRFKMSVFIWSSHKNTIHDLTLASHGSCFWIPQSVRGEEHQKVIHYLLICFLWWISKKLLNRNVNTASSSYQFHRVYLADLEYFYDDRFDRLVQSLSLMKADFTVRGSGCNKKWKHQVFSAEQWTLSAVHELCTSISLNSTETNWFSFSVHLRLFVFLNSDIMTEGADQATLLNTFLFS